MNLSRIGFAPLLEPLLVTYAIGPGTAGLVALLLAVTTRHATGRTPGGS